MKFAPLLGLILGLATAATRVSRATDAAEIIAKLREHSEASTSEKNSFAYRRVSKVDYFDADGDVKKKSVRVYQVEPVDGKPVSRLIEINGRPANEKDEDQRSAARKTGDKTRSLDLGDDLLARYDYTLRGEEVINGRRSWALEFTGKNPDQSGFLDRLLNNLHGTLWVDQEDYDVAKMDVHLGRKISFFGGIAGSIEKLDVLIVQKRVSPAVWLSEALTLDFSGRKLFSPLRFRCYEDCSEFHKSAGLQARNP